MTLYKAKYSLWEKTDEACNDRKSGHTGEQRTFTGYFNEPSKMDVVNAIVYELRGAKSHWELAYVDEITEVEQ